MDDSSNRDGTLTRWRAERARRAQDRRALQSEFELHPRGRFAALRALAANVADLERERIRSHAEPAPPAATPAKVGAERAHTRPS